MGPVREPGCFSAVDPIQPRDPPAVPVTRRGMGSWCDRLGLGEGRGERCDSSASVTTPIGTPPANGGSASATARHTAYPAPAGAQRPASAPRASTAFPRPGDGGRSQRRSRAVPPIARLTTLPIRHMTARRGDAGRLRVAAPPPAQPAPGGCTAQRNARALNRSTFSPVRRRAQDPHRLALAAARYALWTRFGRPLDECRTRRMAERFARSKPCWPPTPAA